MTTAATRAILEGGVRGPAVSRRALAVATVFIAPPTSLAASDLYFRHRVSPHASLEVPRSWRITSEFNADFEAATRERQRAARLPEGDPSRVTFSAGRYLDSGQALAWMNVRTYPQETVTNVEVVTAPDAEIAEFDAQLRAAAFSAAGPAQFAIVSWIGTTRWRNRGVTFLVSTYERSPLIGTNHTRGSNVIVRLVRLLDGSRSLTLTIAFAKSAEYIMRPIADHIALSLQLER